MLLTTPSLSPTMATFLTNVVSIKPTVFSFQSESFTPLQTRANVFSTKPFPSLAGTFSISLPRSSRTRIIPYAVMETEEKPAALDPSSEAARRVYIGNIPRTVDNDQLTKLVEEHGAVEKVQVMYDKYSGRSRRFGFATMKSVEDANAVVEKLNGNTIEGREIKVNITEKPIASSSPDLSLLQSEDSAFVDSPYKVYVGNLAKTVTKEMLENLFSEKGKVVSAKVSRVPGTSKSTGFGFVTFSSEEDVEAAILALNNSLLEGQKIRVNKACMGHNKGWEEAASMLSGASVKLKTCNAALLQAFGNSWEEAFALSGPGGWKLEGVVAPDSSIFV